MGPDGTELIRQLNVRLSGRLNQREYGHVVREVIAPRLSGDARRGVAAQEELDWARTRAEQDIAFLCDRGYPINGDLADLLPVKEDGPQPDEAVPDTSLLEVALDALAYTAESCGNAWWAGQRRAVALRAGGGSLLDRARGAAFRSRRAMLERSDEVDVLQRGLGVAFRIRGSRQRRAADAARAARD